MAERISETLKVACIQMQPLLKNKTANLLRCQYLIGHAIGRGARLMVLPELCTTGYSFGTFEEAMAASEETGSSEAIDNWSAVSNRCGLFIVGGICERDGDSLFNSAVLIGPSGHLGTYRKIHLWNNEKSIFQRGNIGYPVFDTCIGKIGVLICYDAWFPESIRECVLGGAEIICMPTNWVPIPGQRAQAPAMATILLQAASHSNSVFIAAASRIGIEGSQSFIGQSVIVDCEGWPVSGPASAENEQVVYADIDLSQVESHRQLTRHNHLLNDREPTTYLLGKGCTGV